MAKNRLLTVRQAARLTGIPESVLKDAIWRRELKTRSWFRRAIDEQDFLNWRLDHSDDITIRMIRALREQEVR